MYAKLYNLFFWLTIHYSNYLKLNLPFVTDILIIILSNENKNKINLQFSFLAQHKLYFKTIPYLDHHCFCAE